MDNLENNPSHDADRYLLGQMNEGEQDRYLARLLQEPGMQSELEDARFRLKAVRGRYKKMPQPGGSNQWVLPGILLLIIGAAVVWYLWSYSSFPAPSLPANPTENTPASPLPAPVPPSQSVQQQSPEPIAGKVDLQPNPTLEYLLGETHVRSGENAGILWAAPPPKVLNIKTADTRQGFRFTAALKTPAPENIFLQWSVYSNKLKDYENEKFIFSEKLDFSENSNVINFNLKTILKPGLYYYIIENQEGSATFFVGKIIVN